MTRSMNWSILWSKRPEKKKYEVLAATSRREKSRQGVVEQSPQVQQQYCYVRSGGPRKFSFQI